MSAQSQFHAHVILVTHSLSSRTDLETVLASYQPRAIIPVTDKSALLYVPLAISAEEYKDQLKTCPSIQDSHLVARGE